MNRKHLWLILGFSFLVHLPGLTSPLLDYHAHRQTQTMSMARNFARHGMHFLSPEVDNFGWPTRTGTEFPIYSYLVAFLFKLFGERDLWGRLLSCVFAAGGAVFLYRFVQRRLGERSALWAALSMCVVPVHLYFTRAVMPEPMALWGVLGFLDYFDKAQRETGSQSWGYYVAATVLGAFGPMLKLPYLYALAPLYFLLILEKYPLRIAQCAWRLLPLGVILLATGLWYRYARTAPAVVLPLDKDYFWNNLQASRTAHLWEAQLVSRLPEICFTYAGLVFAVIGGTYFWKNREHRWFLAWLLVGVFYTGMIGDYGLIHRYTLLPWAPIAAVYIGMGIACMQDWAGDISKRRALWLVLVLAIPIHAGFRIKHWYRVERQWLFRARDVVARVSTPKDLWITNTAEDPVLLYYIDRYGFSVDCGDKGLTRMAGFKIRGAKFFLTPTEGNWSKHPEFAAYFNKTAKLLHTDPEFVIYQIQK